MFGEMQEKRVVTETTVTIVTTFGQTRYFTLLSLIYLIVDPIKM